MNVHLTSHGQGQALVFFHGWGFDSHVWLSLIPALKSSYQLILVDLPGFGLSDSMDWPVFKRELLRQLPAVFALVGWSLGGLYAMRLAIEAPKRVSALINVASSPRFIGDDVWPGVSRQIFTDFHANLTSDPQKTLRDFVRLQAKRNVDDFVFGDTPSQSALSSGLHILDSWDLRDTLKDLKVPTSFFFGRLDPITPVKTMRVMQEQFPYFNYVLFNKAAHMPFISHPDEFIDALTGCVL